MAEISDIAVIGGGINGCGIARDAAGRGYSVHLCEMGDLGGATSSASTKLIHGGLRYLEYYEFRLVRESLEEREILWRMAPHLVEPLRFVLPHHRGLRPAWMLRLGLFLYDHIGGRKLLAPTKTLDLSRDPAGEPLKPGLFRLGFEYSDCRVDDARLVVATARDAAARGATISTRTKLVDAWRSLEGWRLELENVRDGSRRTIGARMVVDAAGPWVGDVLTERLHARPRAGVRLVQGSHVVTRRLFDHDRCYIFQNADGRVIFAIPYAGDFTLIGTTDRDYVGDPADVHASEAEIDYLLAAAGDHFRKPIDRDDVAWSYSGVRPLYDDGASEARAATRDYVFETDDAVATAPLVAVYGGKLTTYRRLAEAAMDEIERRLGRRGEAWTETAPLPGGDFAIADRDRLIADLAAAHPEIADEARRLIGAYGADAAKIFADGAGRRIGAHLSEAEIAWMMREEWAETADDVLWRRSKLGLRTSTEERAALEIHMAARRAGGG
ncbi:MAG: glycerol-3-phosphate dehydrogenase [Hyphomicrobiales bacterium]|nr:glycerol-3-phosphate dehydrogenase [Hyphomicrobiales bacterium]